MTHRTVSYYKVVADGVLSHCVILAENSWRLAATKEMALLMVCFAYTGLNSCELEAICLIFGHILNLKVVNTLVKVVNTVW